MTFPLAVHNYIHLGIPCQAINTFVLNNGGSWWAGEAEDVVSWDWPFPAGGFDGRQDSQTNGLARFGAFSVEQNAYGNSADYSGKWPINSCGSKLNLYAELTDGNSVGGISQPYFVKSPNPILVDSDDFFAVIGRPQVDVAISGSNIMEGRVWRGTFYNVLNNGTLLGAAGNLQMSQNSSTGDMTFTFTHPGRRFTIRDNGFNGRDFIDPDTSSNQATSVVHSPGTTHGWLPITVNVQMTGVRLQENWNSGFGTVNNEGFIFSSTVTIGVEDQLYTMTESELYFGGNSSGWQGTSFVDPADHGGTSSNGATYFFDSKLALGAIGDHKGLHLDFYNEWVTNTGWST